MRTCVCILIDVLVRAALLLACILEDLLVRVVFLLACIRTGVSVCTVFSWGMLVSCSVGKGEQQRLFSEARGIVQS